MVPGLVAVGFVVAYLLLLGLLGVRYRSGAIEFERLLSLFGVSLLGLSFGLVQVTQDGPIPSEAASTLRSTSPPSSSSPAAGTCATGGGRFDAATGTLGPTPFGSSSGPTAIDPVRRRPPTSPRLALRRHVPPRRATDEWTSIPTPIPRGRHW